MSKKTFLGVMVVALAVLVAAGGLYASNMGFKLNYQLLQTTGGTSLTGTSSIALPDNKQTGMADAKNLMDDIGFNSTQNVQRWLRSSDQFQPYTGRKGTGAVFGLAQGEGNLVKMATTVNYIVVGSDNPTLSYNLQQTTAGVSLTGTSFYAYNYHQTATDAKALMDDIGFASAQNVQRWLRSSDQFQPYTGRKGTGAVFALVPGEAYLIKMATTVNYPPSHY